MNIKITSKNGTTLKTAGKYCTEDINITLDSNILGSGSVITEEKTFTPTESVQTYTPTSGTYISKVTVNAIQTETKSVTPTTASQTVTPTSGKYLKSVSVGAISTQTKSVTASTSSTTVTPDSGKYLTSVTVAPTPSQSKTATPSTSSQTIKPDSGKLLSQVTVNAISTQTKTATPTTSSQTIKPDSGKYLTQVTVNAIPSTYKNTSDATAVAGDLLSGKTAYNSSGKITGTITSYDGSYEGNAGSGGGGSEDGNGIQTCTLIVNKIGCNIAEIMYTSLDPMGVPFVASTGSMLGTQLILNYVVCGSVIVFDTDCMTPNVGFYSDMPPAYPGEEGMHIGTSRVNMLICQAPMLTGYFQVTITDLD